LGPFNLINHLIGRFGLNDVSQTLRNISVVGSQKNLFNLHNTLSKRL